MSEPDDHGPRGGVCEACELPLWMCEGNPGCFAKDLPDPPVVVHVAEPSPTPPIKLLRPAVIRPGVEKPTLVTSLAHLAELGHGDDLELRGGFERGLFMSGLWLVPHPDERS